MSGKSRFNILVLTTRTAAVFRIFYSNYLQPAYINSCIPKLVNVGLILEKQGKRFLSSYAWLWERSASKFLVLTLKKAVASLGMKLDQFGLPRWEKIFEGITILIVVFMPALGSWGFLMPLLFLRWLSGHEKQRITTRELAAFGLALVVSAILSPGLRTGIAELYTYGTWILMAWLAGRVFSPVFSRRVVGFLVLSSLIWISIGFLQQWSGVPTPPGWLGNEQAKVISVRIYSLFGNPNMYALYLLSVFVFAAYFLARSSNFRSKLTFFIILFMVSVSLYWTYSRTAWLIGGIFSLAWFWKGLGKRRWVVSGVFCIVLFTLAGFRIRVATLVTLSDASFWYRIRIWEGVIQVIRDYGLWGAGPGNFNVVYPWHQIGNTISSHAHQLFLQLWLEHGFFSLLAFVFFIRKIFSGFRKYHEFAKVVAIVVLIFLGYGVSESWFQNRFIGGYFWLLCGVLLSLRGEVATE